MSSEMIRSIFLPIYVVTTPFGLLPFGWV